MLLRKRKRAEQAQRRYADHIPGTEVPPPPPLGRASIRLTVSVDVETWARAHGMTVEEADRELGRRVNDAASRLSNELVAELGDMGDVIQSATVSTGS